MNSVLGRIRRWFLVFPVFPAVSRYVIAGSCSVAISDFLDAGCVGLSYHWVALRFGFGRSDNWQFRIKNVGSRLARA